jgi:hypothetical protein
MFYEHTDVCKLSEIDYGSVNKRNLHYKYTARDMSPQGAPSQQIWLPLRLATRRFSIYFFGAYYPFYPIYSHKVICLNIEMKMLYHEVMSMG